MEVVGTYLQLMEAEAACGALKAAGIPATVLNREIGVNVPYYTQGLQVGVPAAHLAAASALLAALPAHAETLPPEDAIPPRRYGEGWIAPGLLLLAGVAALWGVRELVWAYFFAADGFLGRIGPTHWAALVLVAASAGLYLTAAWRLNRRLGRAFLFWLFGWLAAVSGDALVIAETLQWYALNPSQGPWTLRDIIDQYLFGHVAVAALGVAVWLIEDKDRGPTEAP